MKVRIYKSGDSWLMDTTTRVGGDEVAITVVPDRQHLALWLESNRNLVTGDIYPMEGSVRYRTD